MEFSVNMLVTCILYCEAGLAAAVIRTVCKYGTQIDSYHRYHIIQARSVVNFFKYVQVHMI